MEWFDTLVGYTYVIPYMERETWYANLPKGTRKEIRRANQQYSESGYKIETNPPTDDMLSMFEETAQVKGFSIAVLRQRFSSWWQTVAAKMPVSPIFFAIAMAPRWPPRFLFPIGIEPTAS